MRSFVPRKNLWAWAIVGVAVVAFLGTCTLAVVGVIVDSGDEEDPEVALTTATPVPATATVVPTVVPTDECETLEAQAYLGTVGDAGVRMFESLGELGPLFTKAGIDPTQMFDATWQVEVAVLLLQADLKADEIIALTPTPYLQPLHEAAVRLALAVKNVVALTTGGLDNLDSNILESANTAMNQIGPLTDALTSELVRLCG